MVNKCRVSGCLTNHAAGEKGTVFELPEKEDLRQKWQCFLKRNDLEKQKHILEA